MSDEILNESELIENDIPDPNETLANFTLGMTHNAPPQGIVSEIIDGYVLVDRPETPQLMALFELPTEQLIELLRGMITQGFQTQIAALDGHGFQFIEGVKAELKTQMTALAAETEG